MLLHTRKRLEEIYKSHLEELFLNMLLLLLCTKTNR